MVSLAAVRPRAHPALAGYARVLVPVAATPESERAVEVACRLAAERHAAVTAVSVVEVPPLLPLDARMDVEEFRARRLHDRAEAVADAYGVPLVWRLVRARQAGHAILDELERRDFDLVVLGAARRARSNPRSSPFGRTVQHVLKGAPCRVLLVAASRGA